ITMKHQFIVIFVLILVSMSSAFSQTKLNHIAYYVKDLEETRDFYTNILSLEETEEPFKDGLHLWYSLGEGVTLHLIEGLKEELVFKRSNHLCLSVADLDDFIERMKSNSIPFTNSKGVANAINVRPDGIRQVYIQDPTGYWIEINDEY